MINRILLPLILLCTVHCTFQEPYEEQPSSDIHEPVTIIIGNSSSSKLHNYRSSPQKSISSNIFNQSSHTDSLNNRLSSSRITVSSVAEAYSEMLSSNSSQSLQQPNYSTEYSSHSIPVSSFDMKVISSDDNKIDQSSIHSTSSSSTGSSSSQKTFIDVRDGEEYRIIQIGTQLWMAENLRWLPTIDSTIYGSEVEGYEDSLFYYVHTYEPVGETLEDSLDGARQSEYFKRFGVFYNFAAALGGVEPKRDTLDVTPIQGACPTGWHLPNYADWQEFVVYTSLQAELKISSTNIWWKLGIELKSDSDLWEPVESSGSDVFLETRNSFNFNAIPTGIRSYVKDEELGHHSWGKGIVATFWSSYFGNRKHLWHEYSGQVYWKLTYIQDSFTWLYNYPNGTGNAIRCIKDD
jgi:uncharacterized protein (TIGR02145 family)